MTYEYKGRKIEKENGHYYMKANNGTQRIFNSVKYLRAFIEREDAEERIRKTGKKSKITITCKR